ncbi:hypothetical protein UK12_05605 [Saccharothrix sp. ST-888]|nr:hypothetical protein UK12_05605 [Saccharothrix sp. ST-888]
MDLPGGEVLIGEVRQLFDDLDEENQRRARCRLAPMEEAEKGFRSGSSLWSGPGEPRPQFDTERPTLTERREAKAAGLRAFQQRMHSS